mgnify:CR=1 FL=1
MRVRNSSKNTVILGAVKLERPKDTWRDPKVPDYFQTTPLVINPGDVVELDKARAACYDDADLKALVPESAPVSLPEVLRPLPVAKKPSAEEMQDQKDEEALVKLLGDANKKG